MGSNSTHKVEVFRVEHLHKHPNADLLNILRVFDNYQAVVRISDFKLGDLACYVPPDNILPDKAEYAFLKGHLRIKATRFRGVMSQGLVLPAPAGAAVGDDVAEALGITHYVPKTNTGRNGASGVVQGQNEKDPPTPGQKYDLDSWWRYGSVIPDGTLVEVTEKIHGTNARFTFQSGKMYAGSRNHYRRRTDESDPWYRRLVRWASGGRYGRQRVEKSVYWLAVKQNPWIEELCLKYPDYIFYGEIFGCVQKLRYGATEQGQYFLRIFDIWTPNGFLNPKDRWAVLDSPCALTIPEITYFVSGGDLRAKRNAPILYVGPYSKEIVEEHMSGQSTVPGADHIREGIVIKPLEEMWSDHIGRLVLKAVSPDYLAKDTDEPVTLPEEVEAE